MTAINVQLLTEKSNELADYITSLHFKHDSNLIQRFGEEGKIRCHEDAVFHLNFLAEALTLNHPDMYANYIVWAASMLESRNVPRTDLIHNIDFIEQAIDEILGSEYSSVTKEYFAAAKNKLNQDTEKNLPQISDDNPLKKEVIAYLDYLLEGKRRGATLLVTELIEKGVSVENIYQYIFQVSQYEIGRLWQCNKITVAHEHYCTAATQQIMSGLYQYIFSTKRKGQTLVACSVSAELHELGIRMVTDFFELDGWDTYYLGANMPDNQLIESLKEHKADVLALSVSFPIHVSKAASLVKKIRNDKDLNKLIIMVGGYAFLINPDLYIKVGADAFAKNAKQAIEKANELINQQNGK